ncbi:MAG: 50S ribosomal protein L23 [bacterium]
MSILKVFKKEDDLKNNGNKKDDGSKKKSVSRLEASEGDALLNEDKIKSQAKDLIGYEVLVRPLITEKTASLAKKGKYIFKVSGESNKIMIKNALKSFYGVLPQDVNIIKVKGKRIGMMKKIKGKRKDWKKAIVTLKRGESINVYEIAK